MSGKNRKLIASAIELFSKAITALQDLLQATESSGAPVKSEEGKSLKGRKEEVQELRINRVIVRALQKMVREGNEALYKIKRKK